MSKSLNCDPMRITKKFTGDSCIGKRVFISQEVHAGNSSAIHQAQSELRILRQMWIERLLGNIIIFQYYYPSLLSSIPFMFQEWSERMLESFA